MRRKLFALLLLVPALQWLSGSRPCPAAMPGYVQIQVTALDVQGKPVAEATFQVFDAAHHQLEDPDEVIYFSSEDGKVSYNIPKRGMYYVQVFADSYLPSEMKKVVPAADFVPVTFHLKRAPLPSHLVTTIRATVLDQHRHPMAGAFFRVSSASSRDTHNLPGPGDYESDRQGHVEKTVPADGLLHVRVMAGGYDPVEKVVRAKPGVVSLVFVLRRNGEPLPMGAVVSP